MTDPIWLGFDFGGTKLTAVSLRVADVADAPSGWLGQRRTFSPPDGDAHFDIDNMIQMGSALATGYVVQGIGVSFGGPVDFDSGTVLLSHHVPGWEQMPLQQRLEDAFNAPVRIDNDANVAALGEWRFGAGRGCDHLLYVTVSTGVGGGWVLNKRPFRGHGGLAGEIGHTVVDPNGPPCLCGKRGCVERLASGPYMAQDLARRMGIPATAMSGKQVADLANGGHADAIAVLDRGAWALGVGLGNAANLINPERILLGGGVTKSGERWWNGVQQALAQTTLPEVTVDLLPAQFGDDAPLWGAIALMLVDETAV
jgi:glucokinase